MSEATFQNPPAEYHIWNPVELNSLIIGYVVTVSVIPTHIFVSSPLKPVYTPSTIHAGFKGPWTPKLTYIFYPFS